MHPATSRLDAGHLFNSSTITMSCTPDSESTVTKQPFAGVTFIVHGAFAGHTTNKVSRPLPPSPDSEALLSRLGSRSSRSRGCSKEAAARSPRMFRATLSRIASSRPKSGESELTRRAKQKVGKLTTRDARVGDARELRELRCSSRTSRPPILPTPKRTTLIST